MTTTRTAVRIGDLVQKRSARDPYPPLYRVVEVIEGGSRVLVRPSGGGELITVNAAAIRKAD